MTERILLPAMIIGDPTGLHDLDLPPETIAITTQGEALQLYMVSGHTKTNLGKLYWRTTTSTMRNFELTEIDYPLTIILDPTLTLLMEQSNE